MSWWLRSAAAVLGRRVFASTIEGNGPNGTEYYVTITVQSAEVDAALTDFPVYVSLANAPAAFWTNVQSDGGDIRVTESDGTTRCPVDLVSIDTTGETGELHFLASSLSASANTVFRVYYGKTGGGLSQPAVTGTYGRNAVWADYLAVWHMDSFVDATGNGNTLEASGTVGSSAGKLAGTSGFDTASNTGHWRTVDTGLFSGITSATISGWSRYSSNRGIQGGYVAARPFNTSTHFLQVQHREESLFRAIFSDASTETFKNAALPAQNTWFMWHGRYSSTGSSTVVNGGAEIASETITMGTINANHRITFGTYWDDAATRRLRGALDEIRLTTTVLSNDWIAAEYSNQNTPTTFYSVGTQQSA